MTTNIKPLIQKLTETFSPSGSEDAIREVIRAEIRSSVDELSVDALGNLIAHKAPTKTASAEKSKRIMLAAHMDEIGLMATHIDENGFIRFTSIGGVRAGGLIGSRVRFLDGQAGVIHIDRLADGSKAPTMEQCFIDVGASSEADCPVKVGDVCAFERPFMDLGRRLVAKSMDDRIGCVVLIGTLRALRSTLHDLYFVFTTQEEIGTRGASTSAFGVDPAVGIAVDVTLTGDTPRSARMAVSLGDGPAIKVKDSGMLSDPRIVEWMVKAAEKSKIPYQREVLDGGSTDARAIQLARAGVPAGCISVPCRYVHSPSEMVDYEDVQNCIRLLTALLSAPFEL